jgi:hypothetical protein
MVLTDGVTQAHVDGAPVALAAGTTPLPGGGEVVRRDSDTGAVDGYEIHWPDGSVAHVDDGGYGYRLLIRLAADRAGEVEGLLGNLDGDPTNDIVLPAGTVIDPPYTYDDLYPSYADSWRVAADASLFTYADGTSTETFTDRDYPQRALTLDDLDAATRERAERACRWAGVTDAWLFTECVFDVAVTGRPELAVATAATARTAPPAAAPIAANPVAEGPVTPGEAGLTFPGRAGDPVVVDVVAPTLASGCSPVRLVDPAGEVIARSCLFGGASVIGRTELDSDGDYAVVIDARPGDTGRAMVRVYTAEDVEGSITPNGDAVTPMLDRPGSHARYTFAGSAGQRVFVEAMGGTLPGQCSPLRLEDPSGGLLGATCLYGGRGAIGGEALPVDGTYTVVLDPSDRTTGTVHMRLYVSTDQVGTIELDGEPVTVDIDTPGGIAVYEFVAAAGTSVTVEGTDATVPSSCSPLGLFTADGDRLAATCLFGGAATIEPTILPADGRYRVVMDPAGAGTGSMTLTVRSA